LTRKGYDAEWNYINTLRAGYDILVLWNQLKTSSCQLPYQHPSSSAHCARELFQDSNESANLLVRTRKKFFGWALWISC